jgi:phage shock protein B
MTSVLVVALVFGSILTFAALICGTILALAKMRQSGLSKGTKNSRTDEAKIIQEIYQGLSKMEARIEALETILMDSQDKKDKRNE